MPGIFNILNDTRFNTFFSFIVGVGIVCIVRPICKGIECSITKAPGDKDFDKHVYRIGGGKCAEFHHEISECPKSGAIEAYTGQFSKRGTPINRRE